MHKIENKSLWREEESYGGDTNMKYENLCIDAAMSN